MATRKRRTGGTSSEHRGRVTVPVDRHPAAPVTPESDRPHFRAPARPVPPPTSRYTPPARMVRVRPEWHRAVGWLCLVIGIAIAILNDVMLIGGLPVLLPGGHNELYLVVGVATAAWSLQWFGWFDRTR